MKRSDTYEESKDVLPKKSKTLCPKSRPLKIHQSWQIVAVAEIKKILRSARGLDLGEVLEC